MEIVTVKAKTETPNPFTDDVAQLVTVTNEYLTSADSDPTQSPAGVFVLDSEKLGALKLKIQKAANSLDRTAVIVDETPGKKDGTTNVTVRVKARQKSGPRRKGGTVDTGADVAGEATAE